MAYTPQIYVPGSYQQPFQPNYGQQPYVQPQMPVNNGMNWVQGEAGAKSWMIGKGETVMLMDSEDNVFYIKSSDSAGMPLPLRIFDYKERTTSAQSGANSHQNNEAVQFATREDFEALNGKYEELMEKVKELQKKQPARKEAKADE